MIKRDITETVYEYDKEGKLLKKTVIETHEEEDNTVTNYPSWTYLNGTNPCFDSISTLKTNDADAKQIAATSARTTITG
jgi:hypothetical protein